MAGKKGGSIMVHVGRAGHEAKEYILNGNRLVEDALLAAGVSKKNAERIHVNGVEVGMEHVLEDKDVVSLVKNIEGGSI